MDKIRPIQIIQKTMSNGLIIFIYSIFLYGISWMFVFSSGPFRIFEHIRYISSSISEHFGQLFQCMVCFPSNLSWVMSLIDWFLLPQIAFTPFNILLSGTGLWWLAMLMDIGFGAGMVWIIHNVESFFESIAEGNNAEPITEEENNEIIEVNNE